MAKSDSFRTSGWQSSSGDVTSLLFSWTAEQSIENNTSTISWTLQGHRTKATNYVKAGGFKVVIDGETVYSKSTDYRIELRNGTLIASGTKTITHKPDGTRSFTVYVEGGIYYYAVNCTGTHTFTLDTIPRASTITLSGPRLIGSTPTIEINAASQSFSHTVTYKFGKLTGTIAEKTRLLKITNWEIPRDLYTEFPNDTTMHGVLYCTTYSAGNKIGETQADITVFVQYADCLPSVSGTVKDVYEKTLALTGDENTLIRGHSGVMCVVEATAKYGAQITKMLVNAIQCDGSVLWDGVDTGVFDFYVEDTRGCSNHYMVTKTLIPYVPLTARVEAYRDDPTSGNATIEIEGSYFDDSFGVVNNTLTILYKQWDGTYSGDDEGYTIAEPTIAENDHKYSCKVALNLDYTKAFPFEVVVKDKLGVVTKNVTIGKGIPVFDWGEDDFNFNVPVTINGVNLLDKLAELEALIKAKG